MRGEVQNGQRYINLCNEFALFQTLQKREIFLISKVAFASQHLIKLCTYFYTYKFSPFPNKAKINVIMINSKSLELFFFIVNFNLQWSLYHFIDKKTVRKIPTRSGNFHISFPFMSTIKEILIIKLENETEVSCIVSLKVTGRWR